MKCQKWVIYICPGHIFIVVSITIGATHVYKAHDSILKVNVKLTVQKLFDWSSLYFCLAITWQVIDVYLYFTW